MRRFAVFPALPVLLVLLAGCGVPAAPVTAGETTAAPAPLVTRSPTPIGPTVPEPSGQPDKSAAAQFGKKVRYPDGVVVYVTRIRQTTLSSLGSAGEARPGTPVSVLSSGSRTSPPTAVEILGAAALTYGPAGEAAVGAYDNGIEAIGGMIAPGKARTGTYGFVVPEEERDDVRAGVLLGHEPSPMSRPCSQGRLIRPRRGWPSGTSRSVSRILSGRERPEAIIHLRPLLPAAWCDLPGDSGEQPSNASAGAGAPS